jgi:hypothetical protein
MNMEILYDCLVQKRLNVFFSLNGMCTRMCTRFAEISHLDFFFTTLYASNFGINHIQTNLTLSINMGHEVCDVKLAKLGQIS